MMQLEAIRLSIRQLERDNQRPPNSVILLAVSKGQPIRAIQEAIIAGQRHFGENYLQEALAKITVLNDPYLIWHFLGPVQTNKTLAIARHFSWVHSIKRLKEAIRLNQQRPANLPPLNVCLQVNIDQDPAKAGVSLAELPELAKSVSLLPRLRLRGLMTILAAENAHPTQSFHRLAIALQNLQDAGLPLDTLSMGMSKDYHLAIAQGATLVRVGTAIFGQR